MTIRMRLLAGDAGSSAGGTAFPPPPRLLHPSPEVSSPSTSANPIPPSSAPPPRPCGNKTTSGQGNNGPPCVDPRGVGYIVGGMLCVLAGVIICISIIFHFYRRNNRRAYRVGQGPITSAGQGQGQDGRPAITAPPISVQSLDDGEGSKKGVQQASYTTSVCVRLPGNEQGLFIAWPEQQLPGSKSVLSVLDSEEGSGHGQAPAADPVVSFRENLASGRFWLSDFLKYRRALSASSTDKGEGAASPPTEVEGGPSPDSTVHSSYEAALAMVGVRVVSGSPVGLGSRDNSIRSLPDGAENGQEQQVELQLRQQQGQGQHEEQQQQQPQEPEQEQHKVLLQQQQREQQQQEGQEQQQQQQQKKEEEQQVQRYQ